MNLEEAIRTCLGKYIEVRGRASRHEFWWFVLFLVAGSTAAALADAQLTRMALPDDPVPMLRRDGILSFLFFLAAIPPTFSAAFRRLHDTGRSGMEMFYPSVVIMMVSVFTIIAAQPLLGAGMEPALAFLGQAILFATIAGPMLIVFWLAQPGEPTHNEYGPVPEDVA